MNRSEIEARARAEALVRDEEQRWEALAVQVRGREAEAGWSRRALASIASSHAVGLLAGDGLGLSRSGSEAARQALRLRRRRFRATRRLRVLEQGEQRRHVPRQPGGPLWLSELGDKATPADPSLRQRVLADLLAGGGASCTRAARVLVDPKCPPRIAASVAELGLALADGTADADVAIVVSPNGSLGFDWILSGERSVASVGVARSRSLADGDATALGDELAASARAAAFCVRIASRDWEAASVGGDAALARSLARALGERGHQALLQVDSEASLPAGTCLDVQLVLRGRPAGEPSRGRLNLIWQISHPGETTAAELSRYDGVLVASTQHAERLRASVGPPVKPLLQFTDPELFHPAPDHEPGPDVAFVGNWRGEFRRIVWDALQAGHSPALYGRGWDLLAPEHAVAEHIPHDELYRLYSSCKVLLCDHWEDMRRLGFISNRVFDALACETFVLADDNPALAEELPGAVETYSAPAELGTKLEHYLDDPSSRRQIATRGRELVASRHTVERRAGELLAIAAEVARQCDRRELDHLRDPARWNGEPAAGASAGAAAPGGAGAE